MADPQNATSAAQPGRAQSNAEKTADKTVEGERRSFDDGAEAARKLSQTTGEAVRDMTRAGADANRQIAETSRRAGQDIADQWRSSLQPFTAMQMDMNRWLDDMWRFATGFSAFPTPAQARPFGGSFGAASLFGLPAADVREAKDAYTLAVELPGLAAEDLDLSLQGDSVVVCGHKGEEKQDATAAYRISERRFGRFERTFPLPPQVDPGRIEARFREGVLTITLPKTARATEDNSKIEIKT
jgi:HSP20 family protein